MRVHQMSKKSRIRMMNRIIQIRLKLKSTEWKPTMAEETKTGLLNKAPVLNSRVYRKKLMTYQRRLRIFAYPRQRIFLNLKTENE